jgi:TRAP-type transport system periplasmic protein
MTASAAVQAYTETQRSMPVLSQAWTKHNQVVLATIAIESFSLFSKKPIRKVDDFKGVKVGVIGPNANWLRGTGAVPVTLNLGQITNDLANGIFETVLAGDSVAGPIRVDEAAGFRTQFDIGAFVFACLTINRDKFNSLPPEVRDALVGAAAAYEKWVAEDLQVRAKTSVEGMMKAGMVNIEVSAADRSEWAKRMPDIAKEWASNLEAKGMPAKDVIPTYLKNLRKIGEQPVRNWGE